METCRMNAHEEFWEWFIRHQNIFFNLIPGQEQVFDRLAAALRKVDSHLTWSLAPGAG